MDKFVYDKAHATVECATKCGNTVHISGFVKNKIKVGISVQDAVKPKEVFSVPCINYDAWGDSNYQCQIAADVSDIGIVIDASAAPYIYTAFDIWYCI